MKYRFFLPLLFAAASAFAQPATVDETARLLAGLPVEGPLAPLTQTAGWQQHVRAMNEAWWKKEEQQIRPIRAWMGANAMPFLHSTDTVYYMFSGPDFLYANTFFPSANTYILAGLEPVGQVPDLTQMPPEQFAAELAAMRGSLSTMLRFQYFITKDMRAEFGRGAVSGTLPLLYVFLARMGHTVIETTRVSSPAEGVKITFKDPAHAQTQTLFYFKTDLSGSSGFLKWCAARGPGLSLLKAASYLMHGDGFSGVRNFLLQNSRVIIQDDSGIPLRAFPKSWKVDCYGRYVRHQEMFGNYYQPDLAAVFATNPPSELGFAFGYHWQKDRGILMMATRGAKTGSPVEVRKAEPEVRKAEPVER